MSLRRDGGESWDEKVVRKVSVGELGEKRFKRREREMGVKRELVRKRKKMRIYSV